MNEKTIERHLETKLPITVESFRYLFDDWNEKQRIEVIKALIWTNPDNQGMLELVRKTLNNPKFEDTID